MDDYIWKEFIDLLFGVKEFRQSGQPKSSNPQLHFYVGMAELLWFLCHSCLPYLCYLRYSGLYFVVLTLRCTVPVPSVSHPNTVLTQLGLTPTNIQPVPIKWLLLVTWAGHPGSEAPGPPRPASSSGEAQPSIAVSISEDSLLAVITSTREQASPGTKTTVGQSPQCHSQRGTACTLRFPKSIYAAWRTSLTRPHNIKSVRFSRTHQ